MAYRVNVKNKKNGVTYVYECVSFWDKEKKQPGSKRTCIGKIDPKTGEFMPSKRLNPQQAAVRDPAVTATAKIVGPSLLLDHIVKEIGIRKILKTAFPKDHLKLLTMAYYLTAQGGALSHCENWSKQHDHPYRGTLSSQRISEIIRSISLDAQQTFIKKWSEKVLEHDYLCYDITSVSSYSELNEYLKYGYNRDREHLKQINLALLFGQKSQLPIYYNRLPGNINDVSTLYNVLKTFGYMALPKLHFVLDKGFFCEKNIDALLEARERFTLAVPMSRKWLQQAIDEIRDDIQGPEGYRRIEGEVLYVHTQLYPWGKNRRRCYLHLYYNAHQAADVAVAFTERLLLYKQELENDTRIHDHEEAYKTFFIIKETPVRGRKVIYNDEVIKQYIRKYAGFFAILTNDFKDPVEALMVYRNKDVVEKCFDDLKNQLDMKRLRVHDSAAMDGRLFVQFIASILMSALRKKMRASNLIEKYTIRELLGEMATLTKIKYSGKYGHILTEVTKPQRHI
ncbi:MAG: transposase, partial [Thermotogota bacterium]